MLFRDRASSATHFRPNFHAALTFRAWSAIPSAGFARAIPPGGRQGGARVSARRPPEGGRSPPPGSSWLLVRHVPRDDLVHRLERVADAFLAHREVDRRDALLGRGLLDLLARHVTHEPGRQI